MPSKSEFALDQFNSGCNCAQAVLLTLTQEGGPDTDLVLKIATGFGSGMARHQEVCGAVSGGIMAIGLRYGQPTPDDLAAKEDVYRKTRDFIARFKAKHGSVHCRELLQGCNLFTEDGRRQFEDQNLHTSVCEKCVSNAVNILDEILCQQ